MLQGNDSMIVLEGRVAVKWLAIESLLDQVCTCLINTPNNKHFLTLRSILKRPMSGLMASLALRF
jgi:hypothetical protein